MMDDPLTRRTERIMKQSDEPNWRSQKWEKPIQEVESPSIVPKTEMSIKLENDDEQNQRSRLKELITQRLEAQSIALATEQENQRNQRSRLEEIIKRRIGSQSIAQTQTPFIEEMESDEEDEESETEEEYKRRREFIHAYLTMDNKNEQEKQEETETDEGIVGTPEEQKRRLLHAYLTSTMEEEETTEEQNERRKLVHAYSKRTMDRDEGQTEQDETEMYLRTSIEEEYNEEEPLEEYEEDGSFKENNDEGKWTTQFSYPTEEEENALFIAFMTGSVEDQKKWINAKMNLAKASTDEETRRREEEILNRIIPTEIVDLDKAFEEEDEEEMNDFSECQTYDQEDEFSPVNRGIYSPLFTEEEESDEFIVEHQEGADAQTSKPLITSYQDHRRQDKETVYPLSPELDDQLIGAKYFTEQDACWGNDNEHTGDKDKWEMIKTNQELFEPLAIFSSPHSPTAPQTNTDETVLNQKKEQQNIVNKDYVIQTKEEDTEDTRSVRTRDNDLFAESEGYTSWETGTKYEGLPSPGNQLQMHPMKLDGIDEWPTPTMTKRVESFLGFKNFDTEFTWNDEDLIKPLNKQDENEQENRDMVKLPERSFPNLSDHEFDDERAFEIDDEQLDPIKTLSAREPETLHKHFSKVAAATSVNDVITVGDMNMDLQKWLTMAQDMNMIVNHTINILLGRRPNIWKDTLKDWLSRTPQLPNGNTAVTTRNILCHYTEEGTTNQSTMSAAHHPMTNGTIKQTRHRTWKLFPTFEFSLNKKITPERKKSFKIDQTSGPVIYRLKFPEILEHKFCNNTEYIIKHNVSDHPSQHVSPKDQIPPHFQNLFDSC